jgi:hypothetical protein
MDEDVSVLQEIAIRFEAAARPGNAICMAILKRSWSFANPLC